MSKWIIVGPDHGRNEGGFWFSKTYTLLDDALAEAAWTQARAKLFGYADTFTVVEVAA